MKQNSTIYQMPYVGCLIGSAYQKLVSRLEQALTDAKLDVSAPEYLILRALYSHDGLQQCEIGEMVGKDKGAVSRTVNNMVRKGLVRTEAISHKCTRVWIDERGRAIEADIFAIACERHKALLQLAPENDIEVFVRVLKRILNN